VGLPFIVSSNPDTGWLVAGAIIGALFGTALPPAFAYATAFLSYDRYVLGQRVARIESQLTTARERQRPSAEEAALVEFVWQLRTFEKKAVVMRDSADQQRPEAPVSAEFADDVNAWRHEVLDLLNTRDATMARRFAEGIDDPIGPEMHQVRNELARRRDLLDRLITAYEQEMTLAQQRREAGG
jgi:hypothetical protein